MKEADYYAAEEKSRPQEIREIQRRSMCQSKFEDMARDAGAIYKLNKLVLVNCDIFEEYLETFRIKD